MRKRTIDKFFHLKLQYNDSLLLKLQNKKNSSGTERDS